MKCDRLRAFMVAAFLCGVVIPSVVAQTMSSQELQNRLVARRAVDAVIWGVPVVSLDMMRQAYFRDAKAKYNDIIWWPHGATWKNQSLATNSIVRYLFVFSNTKNDGPVVLELPPAVGGAGFYGTIMDAWQVPLTDIGVGGKGGKYLLLPPGFKGNVPGGYIPLRLKTYNSYALIRSILGSDSEEDVRKGDALVKRVRIYPLSKASAPMPQRFIDMTDILYEPAVPYDANFYSSLARMIDEEPAQQKDLQMLGMLLPLGIEKGKAFNPDSAMRTILNASAREAQAWLLDGIARVSVVWWPGQHWVLPTSPIGLKTTFLWEVADFFDVDGRGITLADWFGPVSKLGGSSFYLAAFFDSSGAPLQGKNTYKVHVSPNVPVKEFWSITVYDMETSAFFRNSTRLALSSASKDLQRNIDGSVDVYIGPKAPPGKESNWLFTPEDKNWFPWFRFYGPEKAVLDKSWNMPDIELVKQ